MNLSKNTYKEDWQSIKQHETPEWLMDGKFGIYTHWTPVTVATKDNHGDWYGFFMYQDKYRLKHNGEIFADESMGVYEYHVNRFGSPKDFGYKDMIPLFQPKKFNASEWADIFHKSGAKFAGPVAIHHDNFAMWDSKVSRWNMMNNCGFDPLGDLEQAIRQKGMKFITTFHHSFAWHFFGESYKYDGADPAYEDLYCEPHERIDPPSQKFEDTWYDKLDEVMLNYKPDAIWFDFGFEMISAASRQKFMARYYNLADEWQQDVGVCYKIKLNPPVPAEAGILDFELGRSNRMLKNFWMTDTSIGPWFYQDQIRDGSGLKSSEELITMLIDIVSKNGCLLLNVTPDDHGEIVDSFKSRLEAMGSWLAVNGEAIYDTRPWLIFGEGGNRLPESSGGFNEVEGFIYKPSDVRYTRSKDCQTVYASLLAWPGNSNTITLKAFSKEMMPESLDINNISMLGCDEQLLWHIDEKGLTLKMPTIKPHMTTVLKIESNEDIMAINVTKGFCLCD